jgi:hypothetical protein
LIERDSGTFIKQQPPSKAVNHIKGVSVKKVSLQNFQHIKRPVLSRVLKSFSDLNDLVQVKVFFNCDLGKQHLTLSSLCFVANF